VKGDPGLTVDQTARDTRILLDRVRGDTLAAIGKRYGMTHQNAHVVVLREGTRQINDLEMRLLANRATGDVELFLIPDHGGPDFDLAIEYVRWALRELAQRGVQTRVHYRAAENGVAFGVEDITDYAHGGDV